MRLGFFLALALDEVNDVRMIDIQNNHLGRASGLAARLDHAGEGIEAFHEAQRTAGRSAAAQSFGLRTQS